jgi:tetratricopeptide (TPR) repeat protein
MNRAERRRKKKLSNKTVQQIDIEQPTSATAQEAAQQGSLCYQSGKLDEAISWYKKSLEIQPDDPAILNNLGRALQTKGDIDGALEYLYKALTIKSDFPAALNNIGNIMLDQGKTNVAEKCYQSALSFEPDNAYSHYNLGKILEGQGDVDSAVAYYQKAILIKADFVLALNNISHILLEQGKFDNALTYIKKAISITPDCAEAHENNAMAQYNMGFVNLALNNLDDGWKRYEFRLLSKAQEHNFFSPPRWQGEPLDGKTVLVYAEQGLGDELTFSLLFTELAEMAKRCIVLCDPRLESLFARSLPGIEVIGVARSEYPTLQQRLPPLDYQVAAGSLIKFIRPNLQGLKPSLVADHDRVEHWNKRLAEFGPEPKIGISWSTGKKSSLRLLAHSRLEQWGPILTIPGVSFVNLFYGDCTEEIEAARSSFNADIIDLGGKEIDLRNDLDDIYAMMSALDLIITTSSAVATLSCNLGRKCLYFYSPRNIWKTLGTDSIPWFMDAIPLFFSNLDEFESAAKKAGEKVRALAASGKKDYQ